VWEVKANSFRGKSVEIRRNSVAVQGTPAFVRQRIQLSKI
jgi:hypothetical protein